jgi:hypothetical protein
MKQNEIGRACCMHGTRERGKRFWCESLKERDQSEDRGMDGSMGLEWILGRLDWGGCVWSGFTWLRIGTSGWLS